MSASKVRSLVQLLVEYCWPIRWAIYGCIFLVISGMHEKIGKMEMIRIVGIQNKLEKNNPRPFFLRLGGIIESRRWWEGAQGQTGKFFDHSRLYFLKQKRRRMLSCTPPPPLANSPLSITTSVALKNLVWKNSNFSFLRLKTFFMFKFLMKSWRETRS